MLRPSYAELMEIMSNNSKEAVTSRYTVVIAASKRARQLIDGDESMADIKVNSNKPVSIAVEEIREGKITVVPEGQGTKLKPKKPILDEVEIKKELEQQATYNDEEVEELNDILEVDNESEVETIDTIDNIEE